MSIRPIIEHLDGITRLARGLGHRNVTTVQGWWDRDRIPAHRQREVLDYATSIGKPVAPEDIIPSPKSTAQKQDA